MDLLIGVTIAGLPELIAITGIIREVGIFVFGVRREEM